MKFRFIYFLLLSGIFISCDTTIEFSDKKSISNPSSNELIRAFRPVVLGDKKQNPYSVENMLAALDTLKAYPDELENCLKAPALIHSIDISVTDYYVRFLPQDSSQFTKLRKDSSLTLFDFPLDYEIVQTGEYYHDPAIKGPYTWLYTRVPKDYVFPENIKHEVLDELFIIENSPYYSSDIVEENAPLKTRGVQSQEMNDLLKTLEAISFFNSGYRFGEKKSDKPDGPQKLKRMVEKKFLWKTWYEYEYYPSGTIKVESYHEIDRNGVAKRYSTLTEVPLKGVKVFMWDGFFKWNSAYTDHTGYYESDMYYNNDLYYYLHFSGKNTINSWDLDRITLGGVCLWVQKMSLSDGRESNDTFNTTVKITSEGWDACVTNNAFYEFMTISRLEGLSQPPFHLQVALRESTGAHSAPLFQNHTNTLLDGLHAPFFALHFFTAGSTIIYQGAYLLFQQSLPDILISGGRLNSKKTANDADRRTFFNSFYSSIWHELTHASHFQSMVRNTGNTLASGYWSKLIGTEVGHGITSLFENNYGEKGDSNWEMIALAEGWAYFIQRRFTLKFLLHPNYRSGFPWDYYLVFNNLVNAGCKISDIENCLTANNLNEFKLKMGSIYPAYSSYFDEIIK